MGLFNLLFKDNIAFKLTLPSGLRVELEDERVRFIGTVEDISKFAHEIRKVSQLRDGQLARAGKFIFKVSDRMTEDRFRQNWIELPGQGWNVMASKFLEVTNGYEENPFYFNSCGFTKTPFDIGVEVTDLAE